MKELTHFTVYQKTSKQSKGKESKEK